MVHDNPHDTGIMLMIMHMHAAQHAAHPMESIYNKFPGAWSGTRRGSHGVTVTVSDTRGPPGPHCHCQ